MRATTIRHIRDGFLKRNLDQISNATGRVWSVGGLNAPVPDLEFVSFRDPSSTSQIKVFTDSGFGGFSTASLDFVDENSGYARFHGKISTKLPPNRPDIERSGFAGWRTVDPKWTLFGRATFNCEAHRFLAIRLKSDRSRYFVNIQADSIVPEDLYQHRLFVATPGVWETVYIPFQDLVKTHHGGILKAQSFIPKNNLTTVGLGLIDRIPGPFETFIDRIWATNKHDLDIDNQEESNKK
jgi:NADH dehydrogenase [ubiquinone] 1 alpha subcomplex assembly factor 1